MVHGLERVVALVPLLETCQGAGALGGLTRPRRLECQVTDQPVLIPVYEDLAAGIELHAIRYAGRVIIPVTLGEERFGV